MQPLIRNLEQIRRRARTMLIVLRASSWLAVVLGAALLAGFADYLLRLPGWMRLVLVLAGAVFAAYALTRRMRIALRVNPSLPSLALRLETLFPALSGRLASAVAFATESAQVPPPGALERHLTHRASQDAGGAIAPEQVRRLINPRPTAISLTAMLLAMTLMAGVALGAPDSFETAARRWLTPLSDSRWPNRYAVESLTAATVLPNNAAIPFAARVDKGDRDNLRTWVAYRFRDARGSAGPWQRVLMTRQTVGQRYERAVEPTPDAHSVEFYFEAGDDATPQQSIQLIVPPALADFTLKIAPPTYAADALDVQNLDLLQPSRPTTTVEALEGSLVVLRARVTGSFDAPQPDASFLPWVADTFAGLPIHSEATPDPYETRLRFIDPSIGGEEDAESVTFELSFRLIEPLRFHFSPADRYGNRYDDPRRFDFEVRPDREPRVAIVDPRSDQSVLATAILRVEAEGFDDVALDSLTLEARTGGREPIRLDGVEAPATRQATVDAELDLSTLKLQPGDEVSLVGVARDRYRLADRAHDPVESPPRTLRIIAEDELARQVRDDLAELRQRALSAEAKQKRLLEAPPDDRAVREQSELAESAQKMSESLGSTRQRVESNRLNNPQLTETLVAADKLLNTTVESSRSATGELSDAAARADQAEEATSSARAEQAKSAQSLGALAQLLDEGREAYELREKLVKLAREQESLADTVRTQMPDTLGRNPEELDAAQRDRLAQNARRQEELARDAESLTDRMRSTASALARQSEAPDQQAMAEAMRRAADASSNQSLAEKLRDASRQVGQNQLADAAGSQDQAKQTIQEMLEELDRAEKLKQEILRRRLAELAEEIERLVLQQQAQIDRLATAVRFDGLDAPLMTLRGNTMTVAQTARAGGMESMPIADHLDSASGHQGEAVRRLREPDVDPAATGADELASLGELNEALRLARELSDKAQNDESREERRKLAELYNQALQAQQTIRDETAPLADTPADQRGRRWRADSRKLADRQAQVAIQITALGEKVGDTIMFRAAHDRIEGWIESSRTDLDAETPSAATLFRQDMVIQSLTALIESLRDEPTDEEQFAGSQSAGGGQGGGGGPPQPLIPPLAELKLLKARQVAIHQMTRSLDAALDPTLKATILQEAADQQRELAERGDELMQKMQPPQPEPQETPP